MVKELVCEYDVKITKGSFISNAVFTHAFRPPVCTVTNLARLLKSYDASEAFGGYDLIGNRSIVTSIFKVQFVSCSHYQSVVGKKS